MAKDPRFTRKSASEERGEEPISGKEIYNNVILSNHLVDGSVTNSKILDGSVTNSKIATDSVTVDKIAANAVGASELIDGQITDAKMTTSVQQRLANTFTKKQIVHRRILHGASGSLGGSISVSAFTHSSGYYGGYTTGISRFMYGPYGYGAPSVQPGAERRTRIYAIWSDNIQNQIGYFDMRIMILLGSGAGMYTYILGNTWGDVTTPRDGYSNEIVGLPSGAHGTVYFYVEGYSIGYPPCSGAFWYAELQHLDVFP